MNTYRNEMTIKLNGQEIVLCPSFENVAETERNVGGLAYLALKFSRGVKTNNLNLDNLVQSMPNLTDCAKIIFFNQKATNPDDPTLKKLNLEEIWDLIQIEGMMKVIPDLIIYLTKITSGGKKTEELKEYNITEEKKS